MATTPVLQTELDRNRKYQRPQALIFADMASRQDEEIYGHDVRTWVPHGIKNTDWITLSDHNRSELSFDSERIENRRRMVDGSMRSYWTADKRSLSVSWSDLPSRSQLPTNPIATGVNINIPLGCIYTVDGGAGGSELQHWYDTHPGPFYVLMSFDDYKGISFADETAQLMVRQRYTHGRTMFYSSFSASVDKRMTNVAQFDDAADSTKETYVLEYDMWNVSLSLEEA